jgi:hypothetical protein
VFIIVYNFAPIPEYDNSFFSFPNKVQNISSLSLSSDTVKAKPNLFFQFGFLDVQVWSQNSSRHSHTRSYPINYPTYTALRDTEDLTIFVRDSLPK